jgi:GNAT superfamily N-acetyltransferase
MVEIKKIDDEKVKYYISNYILRNLPDWFGIDASITEYVENSISTIFYTALEAGKEIGFISIKANNVYTSEIYVMGILKEYHKLGIGKKLLEAAEKDIKKNVSTQFLMVKTLGESHPDEHYKSTRAFYRKTGIFPLEEIKEIWGEDNPCLILIKHIS